MKKIFLLIFFFSIKIQSQLHVNNINIRLNSNKDVFQIIDHENQKVNLFLSDKYKVNSFILDNQMKPLDTLSGNRPEKKYKDILGYSGNLYNPVIYWSDKQKNKILSQTFNFIERKCYLKEFDIKIKEKGEVFLEQFTENNKFYILVLSEKNHLKLYCLYNESIIEKEFDLSKTNNGNELINISSIFDKSSFDLSFEEPKTITKIISDFPVSLSESAKRRKLYIRNNQLILTFDVSNGFTNLIIINLDNFLFTLEKIQKPTIDNVKEENIKSNSFILDDNIFQIIVCSKQLILSVKNLDGNNIKEFKINDTDDFKINNTPFIRQSNGFERELETTEQFLRKIVRSNFGISLLKQNEKIIAKIGCISADASGGYMAPMNMSVGGGTFNTPAGSVSFQPINHQFNNFYSYGSKRSIYTDCLFDKNFNHINEKISDLTYDKISKFKEGFEANISCETVFKIFNTYIFGYYDESFGAYRLYKFSD
jgi:hypothetical protein